MGRRGDGSRAKWSVGDQWGVGADCRGDVPVGGGPSEGGEGGWLLSDQRISNSLHSPQPYLSRAGPQPLLWVFPFTPAAWTPCQCGWGGGLCGPGTVTWGQGDMVVTPVESGLGQWMN